MSLQECKKCHTLLGDRAGDSLTALFELPSGQILVGVGVPLSRSETLTCPKCEKPTTPVTVNRRKKALALKA